MDDRERKTIMKISTYEGMPGASASNRKSSSLRRRTRSIFALLGISAELSALWLLRTAGSYRVGDSKGKGQENGGTNNVFQSRSMDGNGSWYAG